MIKRVVFLCTTISFVLMASCSNDDTESCRKKGSLSATWADGQALKFNHNIFTEEGAQKIGVQSTADVEFCAPRVGISITDVSTIVGRKELKRYNRDGNFQELSTFVYTADTDAQTELYLLDTLQPHWIEINEVGAERIKGVLHATFAIEEGITQKAWNFPDTLRFREEHFELIKR